MPELLVPTIPSEIYEAYALDRDSLIERLDGGLVNQTLLVTDTDRSTVLQRLSGIFQPNVLKDMQAIGSHLNSHGWETPVLLPTSRGTMYATDKLQSIWRRTNFIRSVGRTPQEDDVQLSAAAGNLIGRWHASMKDFDYRLSFQLPHFHDAPYHAHKLETYISTLPSNASKKLAATTLQHFNALPPEKSSEQQFIHGDPKLTNMLFRDGKPFTLIDFDTVMQGPASTDLGDFLRSLSSRLLHKSNLDEHAKEFVQGYHEAAGTPTSLDELHTQAQHATGRVALVLAMRYLCDIVDASYFGWDNENYKTRYHNHVARTELQLSVARYAAKGVL